MNYGIVPWAIPSVKTKIVRKSKTFQFICYQVEIDVATRNRAVDRLLYNLTSKWLSRVSLAALAWISWCMQESYTAGCCSDGKNGQSTIFSCLFGI